MEPRASLPSQLPRAPTLVHPLQQFVADAAIPADGASASAVASSAVTDSTFGVLTMKSPTLLVEELDPLTAMLMEERKHGAAPQPTTSQGRMFMAASTAGVSPPSANATASAALWSLWVQAKAQIQKDFTLAPTVNVTASFMSEVDNSAESGGTRSLGTTSRARLQQLEAAQAAGGRHGEATVNLSQSEYMSHMQKLQHDLHVAWTKQERVKTLKLAIQASKLLGHTAVPQIYPNMFCFMVGVLETFGQLVFERLRVKAEEIDAKMGGSKPLPVDFTCHDIGEEVKEMCKNWMYKTACIRELLPRFYIETALLKCYRFISTEEELPNVIGRLSHMCRGFGDPLVAVYARTYLSLMASQVIHGEVNRIAVVSGILDFHCSFQDVFSPHRLALLESKGLTTDQYLHILSPALSWLYSMAGSGSSKDGFNEIFGDYLAKCGSGVVLMHILKSFDPSFYCMHLPRMCEYVSSATSTLTTLAELYTALAAGVTKCPTPEHREKMRFLNEAWKTVTKIEAIEVYLSCATVFVGLCLVHYSQKELNVIVKDIVVHAKRAIAAGAAESMLLPSACLPSLRAILTQLATPAHAHAHVPTSSSFDLTSTIGSEEFCVLLDMFYGEHKRGFCKEILKTYVENVQVSSDPIVISTLCEVGKSLHDGIDSLSSEDEKKQLSSLICSFINTVSFGRDMESHLSVLVDCRRLFPNFNTVIQCVVSQALQLAMTTNKLVKGRHTKKTHGFVKGCFAFCHVTIPSLASGLERAAFFKTAGECALVCGCVPHADTFFKAVLMEVPDLPEFTDSIGTSRQSTESRVCVFLLSLLTPMLAVPGHPTNGPFYLVKGLMNSCSRYAWVKGSPKRVQVLLQAIAILRAFGQAVLPFHVPGVESNDVLYNCAPEYMQELHETTSEVVTSCLTLIPDILDSAKQASATLALAQQVIEGLELDDVTVPQVVQLLLRVKELDPCCPGLSATLLSVVARARSGNSALIPLAAALTA